MVNKESLIGEYRRRLGQHDFTYMMSDDNRAYTAGAEESKQLQRLELQLAATGTPLKQIKELWNEYAPEGFGRKVES